MDFFQHCKRLNECPCGQSLPQREKMVWESNGSWFQAQFWMFSTNLLLYNLAEPLIPYVKVGLMTLCRLVVRIK